VNRPLQPRVPASSRPKTALAVVLGLHVLRLLAAPFFELAPQEAYYSLYAQRPALGYFDHPPAVAWMLWPFLKVLGRTELAPRLAAWLATLATGLVFLALARRTLPRARRGWALLVAGTTLTASVVGLIATPDVPLLLFWTLALLFLHRAAFGERRPDWLVAGLFMGLAFDSKYTAVFLQLGLLLFLLASPKHRRLLKTPWPYLSVLVAHLAMAPVYWWNATHRFASFLFQSSGRASNVGAVGLINAGKLLGTQTALLLPPLLLAIGWALVAAVRRSLRPRRKGTRSSAQVTFLLAFSLPAIALFCGLSFVSLVKPNWLMPAYVAAVLLAVRLVPRPAVWRWQLGFALPLFALAAVEVLGYVAPIRSDDTWFGWKELARQVEQRAKDSGAAFVFADDEYKTTAELRFYSDLPAYAGNVVGRRALQFDYLGEDLKALAGQDALFLDSRPREDDDRRPEGAPPADLAQRFAQVEPDAPIAVRHRGQIVRKFLVFRCRGYRPPP
jgi:4-amino-4-deoxy-L-arabinose transferase-like glycosyltransferase